MYVDYRKVRNIPKNHEINLNLPYLVCFILLWASKRQIRAIWRVLCLPVAGLARLPVCLVKRFSGLKSPWSRNWSKSNCPPLLSLSIRAVTGKLKTLQIARICRFEANRRQNTPGKANLRLFRVFSGYFEPFGDPHTFPIKI